MVEGRGAAAWVESKCDAMDAALAAAESPAAAQLVADMAAEVVAVAGACGVGAGTVQQLQLNL